MHNTLTHIHTSTQKAMVTSTVTKRPCTLPSSQYHFREWDRMVGVGAFKRFGIYKVVTVMVTKRQCTICSSKYNILGGKDIPMDIYTHTHKDVENMVTKRLRTCTLPCSYYHFLRGRDILTDIRTHTTCNHYGDYVYITYI